MKKDLWAGLKMRDKTSAIATIRDFYYDIREIMDWRTNDC